MKISREDSIVSCSGGSFEIEDRQASMLLYFHPLNDICAGCKIKKDGYIYYKDGSRKKVFVKSREGQFENLWPGNLNFKKLAPLYEKLKNKNNKYVKISENILKEIWKNGGKAHSFDGKKYSLFDLNKYDDNLWYGEKKLKKKPEKLLNLELGNDLAYNRKFISTFTQNSILALIRQLVSDNLPDPKTYNDFEYLLIRVDSIDFLYLLINSGGYKYWESQKSDVKIHTQVME